MLFWCRYLFSFRKKNRRFKMNRNMCKMDRNMQNVVNSNILLSGRPLQLKRSIMNIIENSLRYSEEIQVNVSDDEKNCCIDKPLFFELNCIISLNPLRRNCIPIINISYCIRYYFNINRYFSMFFHT